MKKAAARYRTIFGVALALLAGCTMTQVTAVPPPGTASIRGSVQLDEMDCTPSASSAGVTVNLLGTNISTVTDSNGNWALDSIPAGTYTIQITKPGFEEYDNWPLQFHGSETDTFYRRVKLAKVRNWRATLLPVAVHRGIFIAPTYSDTFFQCADTPSVVDSVGNNVTETANLYWFVGRTPSVNFADESGWVNFGNGSGPINPNLGNPNERSGDTLYLVAYVAPCDNEVKLEYYSGDTLKTIFTGLGPASNVVKFVLP